MTLLLQITAHWHDDTVQLQINQSITIIVLGCHFGQSLKENKTMNMPIHNQGRVKICLMVLNK